MAEGKDLRFDELKAEVTSNLTEQAHRACAAVDAPAAARRGRARARRTPRRARCPIAWWTIRSAPRVAPSGAGSSGDGLFVRGAVNPGEIVAWYPGLVYDLELVRHIPGYPKVSERNPYLVARYDGSVVDAKPWGAGGGAVDVDADACIVSSHTEAEEGRDGKLGSAFGSFGSWPGPPLDAKETAKETATEGGKKRGGAGGFLDAQLAPDLDPGLRSEARAAALSVQRDNPLALAHREPSPEGHSPQRRLPGAGRRAPRRAKSPPLLAPAQRRARALARADVARGRRGAAGGSREARPVCGQAARPVRGRGRRLGGRARGGKAAEATAGGPCRAPSRRRRFATRRCSELQAEHARGAPGVVPPRGRGGRTRGAGRATSRFMFTRTIRRR